MKYLHLFFISILYWRNLEDNRFLWGIVLIFLRYFLISENVFWSKNNSCYQKIDFLISKNHFLISRIRICDIKKMISWYQEIEFLISENKDDFLYQKFDFLISKNLFLMSRNRIFDIRKSFSDVKKNFSEFFISKNWFSDINNSNSWYQKITCFSDLNFWYQKIIYWYQKFEFLISENDFFDIRKYLKNIKTAPHRFYRKFNYLIQESI